nr:non-homologous end-joining DNA ligase [Candidatus Microthrix sp.]
MDEVDDPGFVQPMLATPAERPIEGEHWVYERKLDGIRLIAVRNRETVRLFTRNGHDRSAAYPEVVEALVGQRHDRFVADAEVVAFDGDATSFARLQRRSGLSDPARIRHSGVGVFLYLFDLMHLEGHSCIDLALRDRTKLLSEAFDFDDPLRLSEHLNGDDSGTGRRLLADACDRGWEGLIAKRADSRYRPGRRSPDWLKLKCVARQELVIGGFTAPKGTRMGLGALLVGHMTDEGLAYAGRVGTGFDDATLHRLWSLLKARKRSSSPFVDAPEGSDVTWTDPDLVCEVGFTEWTSAGRLRHPRFLGLRDDKAPGEVMRELPASAR